VTTLVAVLGGALLVLIAIGVFYFVQTLRSVRQLLETIEQVIRTSVQQIHTILENVTETTSSVKGTTTRIDKTLNSFLSLPNLTASLGREIISSIFQKGKR